MHLASLTHASTGLQCLVDSARVAAVLPVVPDPPTSSMLDGVVVAYSGDGKLEPRAQLLLADCNGRSFTVAEDPRQVQEVLDAADRMNHAVVGLDLGFYRDGIPSVTSAT